MRDAAEQAKRVGTMRERATRRRRPAGLALLVTVAAVVLAGCGGSQAPSVASVVTTTSTDAAAGTNGAGGAAGSGSAPTQTQPEQAALSYARCMRRDGVPNFPDPSSGGGFTFDRGAGVDPSSPAFRAAQAKCERYMGVGPGLAPGTQTHPTAQWLAEMVRAATCMRRHGVPSFPDPTTTIPSPAVLGGAGQISDIDGAVFVFPAATIDTQSPLFTRAAKTCRFPLRNH